MSVILYQGPSMLDGAPIVAILIDSKSKNSKTGNTPQVWIMRSDVEPHTATKTGQDRSICGTCPFAGGQGCYVVAWRAPLAIYRAFRRGRYPADNGQVWDAPMLRIGAYGDPAAVPAGVWENLELRTTGKIVGYTHQWRSVDPIYRRWCMASVESAADAARAWGLGYRTFRVRAPGSSVVAGEVPCPASEEEGKRKACATCRACDGMQSGRRKASVSIMAHGPTVNRAMGSVQ